MRRQRFTGTITTGPRGRVYLPVPFDPDEVWTRKDTHHVTGTVGGRKVRGPLGRFGTDLGLGLGEAWRRDNGLGAGDRVDAELAPEGPQRQDLADDIVAALAASPAAKAFFDSLATFYRKGYLRWIDATTRRPEVRAARIAELVTLLEQGKKQR
ncbi:YdeI/OmpD-associated family protein [Amycolatopsis sp. NPDC049159]|uniref:YdeI/OmpD-associated family protein n=1 Tax=Amycolatopsis sp. NPDC049159 TaxID=3157210 RepID=UPI0033E65808